MFSPDDEEDPDVDEEPVVDEEVPGAEALLLHLLLFQSHSFAPN